MHPQTNEIYGNEEISSQDHEGPVQEERHLRSKLFCMFCPICYLARKVFRKLIKRDNTSDVREVHADVLVDEGDENYYKKTVKEYVKWIYFITMLHFCLMHLMVWIPHFTPVIVEFVQKEFWYYVLSGFGFITSFFLSAGVVYNRNYRNFNVVTIIIYTLALGNLYAVVSAYHSSLIMAKFISQMTIVCVIIVIYAKFGNVRFDQRLGSFMLFVVATVVGGIITFGVEFGIRSSRDEIFDDIMVIESTSSAAIGGFLSLIFWWSTFCIFKGERQRAEKSIEPNVFELEREKKLSTYLLLALRLHCNWIFSCMGLLGLKECYKK